MQALGEMAIGFAGQRVRPALDSVGDDVTALHVHFGYPHPPLFLQISGLFSSVYKMVVAASMAF
jgi:hypothetical protein